MSLRNGYQACWYIATGYSLQHIACMCVGLEKKDMAMFILGRGHNVSFTKTQLKWSRNCKQR